MSVEQDAYRYAVKNAALHGGKADVGALVGKLRALHSEIHIKKTMEIALEAVKKVNAMKPEEIKKEFAKFEKEGYELKPKEKTELLPRLQWAESGKEKVVTRYAPNPNGPFHLGNARAAILSKEFASKYRGKFILRFDDTDPKVKKPIENAEQVFKQDLAWLGCKPDEVFFASNRLEIYYKHLKEALKKGLAYVCQCESEEWRALIREKKGCACRSRKPKEQMQLFEKMLKNEIKEGEAVVRVKTDLEHKDPSVRDWWAAKAVDDPKHVNPKALGRHVWPSYNFASAVDDHLMGVTLIVRGQEHEQNKTKQEFLYKGFGWTYPRSYHFGRISLHGAILSTSKIKEGIESGLYSGWDDPRLGTIRAFRRRGFKAQVLRQAILDLGVNPNDAAIQWDKLINLNKKIIEGESERMPFFEEPLQLDVHLAPDGMDRLVVDKRQFEKFRVGEVVRLRELFNVKIVKKDALQVFADFVGKAKINKAIAGWFKEGKDVEIVMDDNSKRLGLADEAVGRKEKGEMVYFDMLGFCIVDAVEGKKVKLRFTHK
jgi:glutamyl-tRNA synthetase